MKNKELHKKLVQQKKYKAAFIVRQGEGRRQFISNTIRSAKNPNEFVKALEKITI